MSPAGRVLLLVCCIHVFQGRPEGLRQFIPKLNITLAVNSAAGELADKNKK